MAPSTSGEDATRRLARVDITIAGEHEVCPQPATDGDQGGLDEVEGTLALADAPEEEEAGPAPGEICGRSRVFPVADNEDSSVRVEALEPLLHPRPQYSIHVTQRDQAAEGPLVERGAGLVVVSLPGTVVLGDNLYPTGAGHQRG